jgi:hypothetical protein
MMKMVTVTKFTCYLKMLLKNLTVEVTPFYAVAGSAHVPYRELVHFCSFATFCLWFLAAEDAMHHTSLWLWFCS